MQKDRSVPETRAYSILEVKAVSDDERTIEGIASTPSPDGIGDIMEPLGAKYRLPMPLLWHHHHDKPVGSVVFVNATAKGITFRAKVARIAEAGPLKDLVDTAWQSVKAGLVRGVSIGYSGVPGKFKRIPHGGIHFDEWNWRELSLVTIPMNEEATITRIKSIASEQLAASGTEGSGAVPPRRVRQPVTAAKKGKPMARKSYAERIAAFEETMRNKSSEIEQIMDDAWEDGERTLNAEEEDQIKGLRADLASLRATIGEMKALQADEAKKATAVDVRNSEDGSAARGGVHAQVKAPKPAPGIRAARYVRCLALAKQTNSDLMRVAEQEYGGRDPEIVTMVKAAVIASNTTTDAALIGNEGGWADFVEYLRPQTIVGKFGMDSIPGLMPAPFRVPLITEASESAASWVGEGKPKPLTKATWTRTEISPLKVATIAVATMEQLRDSSPAAEQLIRASLSKAVIKRIDQTFISADAAVSGVSPAGILNGVTAIVSTGNDADAIRMDVAAIMGAFASADNPLDTGVWIMSATRALRLSLMVNALGQPEFPTITMRGGTFMGLPVLVSNYADGDTVVLVNAGDIYLADEGGVMVDMSTEASLQMLDNPTNASIDGTATTMVSMFQTNSVAFRCERTLNWMARRSGSIKFLSSVDWGEDASATS